MAKPDSYALAMDGDAVRDLWFLRWGWRMGTSTAETWLRSGSPGWGYDSREVDDLLGRVAAELDAGRPAGPPIENAAFRRTCRASRRYEIDAVDWLLDQLVAHPGHAELAGTGADPWRDLPVAQFTRNRGGGPAERPREMRDLFAKECENAWRDFGEQPGIELRWGRVSGRPWGGTRYELRTADEQAVASRDGRRLAVSGGERSFTYEKLGIPADSAAGSWPPPVVAEIAARSWRDRTGHYALEPSSAQQRQAHSSASIARRVDSARIARLIDSASIAPLVDETGMPILYTSGMNFWLRACAGGTFPSGRWLRFLVRGTKPGNAIMTAVDQAGNKVARYRNMSDSRKWGSAQITVHPDQRLTDELVLAIMESVEWLGLYFQAPSGGGS